MYHPTTLSGPATRFTSTSAGSERKGAGSGGPHRILHCLRAPVGGLFRHVCDLSSEQARQGHLVGVVCDAAVGGALTQARLRALEPSLALGMLRTRMSRELGPSDVSAYVAIRRHARALGIDVIHGHGAKGGAYSRLVARALKRGGAGIVSCYTPHGGSLHYDPSSAAGRIYMLLERLLAGSTDALVFESAYAAARYAAQVGAPACAARVIPNGLGPDDFARTVADADAADFLFVGELRRLKGIDVMLAALAQVRRDAFKAGLVLVVPSRAESFPYIVLEAAAAGLPMLATNVGGIPEIVAGTDTTLLPPEDVGALAEAMLEALDDPPAARARALRLQEAVAARFTVAAMTDAVLDLYDAVLAERPGAGA
jgi:glycosyltransferase involved in cell wall biosynthesis